MINPSDSKVILDQILLLILFINPIFSLFPQERIPIHYHYVLILELLKVSCNFEREFPNMAFFPFHLGYKLVPIAELRDATNHVDVLS